MRHILVALKHHRVAVALIVLEIALTCAIVSNALFLIGDRLGMMRLRTGIADDELVYLRNSGMFSASDSARMQENIATLREVRGVKSVAAVNSLPLTHHYFSSGVSLVPGAKQATLENIALYLGTPGTVDTLGIRLAEGRDFLPQEYTQYSPFGDHPPPPAAIVTRALADRLWPGRPALGQALYLGEDHQYAVRVVGVAEHLLNPVLGSQGREFNLLLPVSSLGGAAYVLRSAPGERGRVLRDAQAALEREDGERVIADAKVYTQSASEYFRDDRAMVWLLLVVVGCLLALSILGVVGLTSFWVQQRTRQIGVRRAIGATRRHILGYFQLENFLIVAMGTALGSAGALLLNLWLMTHYELPHLPLFWLPLGAALLWLLGQASVLAPALRASRVEPAEATRA